MIESGDILEFDEWARARPARSTSAASASIQLQGDVVEDLIIRDRRHLSEDGIVLPSSPSTS